MVTLEVRPKTAERLTELAEERGLDVDALLNGLLDGEEEELSPEEEAEIERRLADPRRFTEEEIRLKYGV